MQFNPKLSSFAAGGGSAFSRCRCLSGCHPAGISSSLAVAFLAVIPQGSASSLVVALAFLSVIPLGNLLLPLPLPQRLSSFAIGGGSASALAFLAVLPPQSEAEEEEPASSNHHPRHLDRSA
jgi:hypothetical protein